jgi:deoxyribodipyrimidine photo-lyase
MIHESRIQPLNDNSLTAGEYVIYWMQASQRAHYNHPLEYAIQQANRLRLPVVAFFGLTPRYPEANLRHYTFMLEGLQETSATLKRKGIKLVVRLGSPEKEIISLADRASLVVADRGYTSVQRKWREQAARRLKCPLIQVESDVIVPVEVVSGKEEYSAATIRPKITKLLPQFLLPLRANRPMLDSLQVQIDSIDIFDLAKILKRWKPDQTVTPSREFHGGTSHALAHLHEFMRNRLGAFSTQRNDPTRQVLSNMSPYLHFGQISPLYIALQIIKTEGQSQEAYLEELIVRRELGMNFVFYNDSYDRFDGLPEWCRKTLLQHSKVKRDYVYTLDQFEHAQTHDQYWNAAQNEMVCIGKMHGYMRMYWGKKIIEWTRDPKEAFQIALYLNNKYELDGRDPNGYAGVAWCFGKHDRPWAERPIFGMIRYMNAAGLKRKFDADLYVRQIGELQHGNPST